MVNASHLSYTDIGFCFTVTCIVFVKFDVLLRFYIKLVKICTKFILSVLFAAFIFFIYKLQSIDFGRLILELRRVAAHLSASPTAATAAAAAAAGGYGAGRGYEF